MPVHFFLPHEYPARPTRREFLQTLAVGGSGLITAGIGIPVIWYLLEPILKPPPHEWEEIAPVDRFTVGQTVLEPFKDPGSVAWSGKTSETAVWVRREAEDSFVVFSEHCTHLGCPVNWLPGAQIFECPCHGGVYYADGTVAAGPPPRPLFRYQTRVVNGALQALTLPLPAV